MHVTMRESLSVCLLLKSLSFLIKIQLNVVPEDLKISNESPKTPMFYKVKCF